MVMTSIFQSFFCVAIFLTVSSACNCIQLLNLSQYLEFLMYLSLLQKMHFFGKTLLLVHFLELVREGVVASEDEGSSVDPSKVSSSASLKA